MPVERNGMSNLRGYVQEAALPRMPLHHNAPPLPPRGHKTHRNHLTILPEEWRRLETVRARPAVEGDAIILDWIKTFIPAERLAVPDADPATGENLSIPCRPFFDIQAPASFPLPNDVQRMEAWMSGYPLTTVQRILHAVFPETHGWEFVLAGQADDNPDYADLFRYFKWTYTGPNANIRDNHAFRSVIVAFQPPWVLSEADLAEFASSGDFPPYRTQGTLRPRPLKSKWRIWARLWDLCARHKTAHFVLTNYHSWSGGAFTDGWTSAYVDEPLEFNQMGPTVVEMLLHTVASAMGLRGTFKRPLVPEPVKDLVNGLVYIKIPDPEPAVQPPSAFPRPPDSESNWDGKSIAPGTSAGAYSEISVALTSTPGTPGQDERWARGPRAGLNKSAIERWAKVASAARTIRNVRFDDSEDDSRSAIMSQEEERPFRLSQRRYTPLVPTIEDVTDRYAMAGNWMG